jgi:hypothetical protein
MKLKTKEDYVRAHKKLWNGIIKEIIEKRYFNYDMKVKVFKRLFGKQFRITEYCFGCAWLNKNNKEYTQCYKGCLFKVKKNTACLNNLWCKIISCDDVSDLLDTAEKIRDFPVRK